MMVAGLGRRQAQGVWLTESAAARVERNEVSGRRGGIKAEEGHTVTASVEKGHTVAYTVAPPCLSCKKGPSCTHTFIVPSFSHLPFSLSSPSEPSLQNALAALTLP